MIFLHFDLKRDKVLYLSVSEHKLHRLLLNVFIEWHLEVIKVHLKAEALPPPCFPIHQLDGGQLIFPRLRQIAIKTDIIAK